MNELHIFAGAGGGILGGMLLGHTCVCAVEIEQYCRKVLLQRQRDGILPKFPIWDDIRTFDGKPWRGLVDVVCGGFPCQDISAAGKGEGITGKRSGLWSEMARIIGEIRPRFAFVENSPMLTSRGLGTVLGDLSEMGYDARWGVIGAHHAGAPHKRDRIWIMANSTSSQNVPERRDRECGWNAVGRHQQAAQQTHVATNYDGIGGCGQDVADANRGRLIECESEKRSISEFNESGNVADAAGFGRSQGRSESTGRQGGYSSFVSGGDVPDANILHEQRIIPECTGQKIREVQIERPTGPQHHAITWWQSEPDVGRVANGVANRVDRLKAIGNGQVPAVAALAWRILMGGNFNR